MLALAYVQVREANSLVDLLDQDRPGIQALAHDHAEPVQRRNSGEVRRHHGPGAGAQRPGAADQCGGSSRGRESEHAIAVLMGRPPAGLSISTDRFTTHVRRSRRACRPRCSSAAPMSPGPRRQCGRPTPRSGSPLPATSPRCRISGLVGYSGNPFAAQLRRLQSGLVVRRLARPAAVQRRADRRSGRGGARNLPGRCRDLPPDRADRDPAGRGQSRRGFGS